MYFPRSLLEVKNSLDSGKRPKKNTPSALELYPEDREFLSGGSSSGSGVAVALGQVRVF